MKRIWPGMRQYWRKAITVLVLAGALTAVWWLLPPQPRLSWEVPEPCRIVGFTAQCQILATAAEPVEHVEPDVVMRLWNVQTGDQTAALGKDVAGPYLVDQSFSPDGKFLVANNILDGNVTMIDMRSNQIVGRFCWQAPFDASAPLSPQRCFSPDGLCFVYTLKEPFAKEDQSGVCLWDTAKRTERYRLEGEEHPVCSPDGRSLATVCQTGRIKDMGVTLWDAATGKERHRLTLDGPWHVQSVLFSNDSRTVAVIWRVSTLDGIQVQLHDVASGALLASHYGKRRLQKAAPGTPLHHCLLRADGPGNSKFVAIDTGEVRGVIHDENYTEPNPTAEQVQLFIDRLSRTRSPESSPDARFLARWESQRTRVSQWWQWIAESLPFFANHHGSMAVKLWDIRTGRKLATILGEHDFAFSTNGQLLAVRRGTNTIQIWDLPPRKPLGWFLAIAVVVLAVPAALWWRSWRRGLLKELKRPQ